MWGNVCYGKTATHFDNEPTTTASDLRNHQARLVKSLLPNLVKAFPSCLSWRAAEPSREVVCTQLAPLRSCIGASYERAGE